MGVKDDVLAQIHRLKGIETLKKHEKELRTKPITDKSVELAEQFITQAFKEKFKNESKELGLKTLDVNLEAIQGKKGETKFGIRLVSAESSAIKEIASEGEKRCIALAAFLSELFQASHQSALVFDDPVSSLDIWHREKIAARLVKEASERQVIVFTHDVLFLNELLAFSEMTDIREPLVLTLGWNNNAPGHYTSGLPWDLKKPNECLSALDASEDLHAACNSAFLYLDLVW